MQPQAALVGADGGIVLDPIAPVHLHLALVIHPGHPEGDHALRLDNALKNAPVDEVGTAVRHRRKGLQHFAHCLQEFGFIGVTLLHTAVEITEVFIFNFHSHLLLTGKI